MRLLAPKTKQSYLFLAPLQWPWQGCCWNLPWESNAVRCSCVPPPPYRHYRHCPSPDHSPPFALNRQPVKRVWPAPDQWLRDQMAACWAGFTSPVAMSCVYGVCAFVLLRCFSCSHTVLPKEHSLGVIFFLLTFLMFMLYFSSILLAFHYWLYSVWLCMWRIIKNLEPWDSGICMVL